MQRQSYALFKGGQLWESTKFYAKNNIKKKEAEAHCVAAGLVTGIGTRRGFS